jgi:RNA polymerase sigma factor (sigma-70 family)
VADDDASGVRDELDDPHPQLFSELPTSGSSVDVTASLHQERLLQQRAEFAETVGFVDFYRAELSKVVGFVIKLGAAPHDAADIAQTTMVLLWKSWHRVDHPRAWVYKVATRTHLSTSPARGSESIVASVPDQPSRVLSPETLAEVAESARAVNALLDELPQQQRMVMAWRMNGFDDTEIARGLNTTPRAVRSAVRRARAALKQLIGKQQHREAR